MCRSHDLEPAATNRIWGWIVDATIGVTLGLVTVFVIVYLALVIAKLAG